MLKDFQQIESHSKITEQQQLETIQTLEAKTNEQKEILKQLIHYYLFIKIIFNNIVQSLRLG
jgi:hypothetical protein